MLLQNQMVGMQVVSKGIQVEIKDDSFENLIKQYEHEVQDKTNTLFVFQQLLDQREHDLQKQQHQLTTKDELIKELQKEVATVTNQNQ